MAEDDGNTVFSGHLTGGRAADSTTTYPTHPWTGVCAAGAIANSGRRAEYRHWATGNLPLKRGHLLLVKYNLVCAPSPATEENY